MMDTPSKSVSSNRNLLIALFFSAFASQSYVIISGLLLIEIGSTFNVPVGIAGQMTSAAAGTAIITAFIIGALTMRFTPRTLLLTGMILYMFSALGCYTAPIFGVMLITYALSGAGGAIVVPMLGTIIGETLSKRDRSKGLGLITAGQPVAFVVGTPIVSYIAGMAGWRFAFLGYMLPVVVLSAAIVYIGIPKTKHSSREYGDTLAGFRSVLSNRSALSCLIGTALFQASMWNSFSFMVSYFRETFIIGTNRASWLLSGLTVLIAIGCVTASSVVNRLGRQRSAFSASFLLGVLAILVYNYGSLWVSIIVAIMWGYLAGVGYVSGDSLTLDQVPEYRGTLMSLNTVGRNVGSMMGALIGGYVLLNRNYGWFGLVLGGIGILASLVYGFLASENE